MQTKNELQSSDRPRLGYACINTCMPSPNRTCIARTFRTKGTEYAVELANTNLDAVINILRWNTRNEIPVYRLSSDMFPHITNPEFIHPETGVAYPLHTFDSKLAAIGHYARTHSQRLSFHPGQFNQIGTPDTRVFANTLRELSTHADILDRAGVGPEGVIVIHGGGVYGSKRTTMERWVKQFYALPQAVRDRLVIENCERCYSLQDMLELSASIHRPVVLDTHHYECYSQLVAPQPPITKLIPLVLDTWSARAIRPKFHVSEQAPDKRPGAHSDYVSCIPEYLQGLDIDIMIEAKMKEQAVLPIMHYTTK